MESLRQILTANPNVLVYRPDCPYSQRALAYVTDGPIRTKFVLMNVNDYPGLQQALIQSTGQRTVPYVIVDRILIGGYDALLNKSQ